MASPESLKQTLDHIFGNGSDSATKERETKALILDWANSGVEPIQGRVANILLEQDASTQWEVRARVSLVGSDVSAVFRKDGELLEDNGGLFLVSDNKPENSESVSDQGNESDSLEESDWRERLNLILEDPGAVDFLEQLGDFVRDWMQERPSEAILSVGNGSARWIEDLIGNEGVRVTIKLGPDKIAVFNDDGTLVKDFRVVPEPLKPMPAPEPAEEEEEVSEPEVSETDEFYPLLVLRKADFPMRTRTKNMILMHEQVESLTHFRAKGRLGELLEVYKALGNYLPCLKELRMKFGFEKGEINTLERLLVRMINGEKIIEAPEEEPSASPRKSGAKSEVKSAVIDETRFTARVIRGNAVFSNQDFEKMKALSSEEREAIVQKFRSATQASVRKVLNLYQQLDFIPRMEEVFDYAVLSRPTLTRIEKLISSSGEIPVDEEVIEDRLGSGEVHDEADKEKITAEEFYGQLLTNAKKLLPQTWALLRAGEIKADGKNIKRISFGEEELVTVVVLVQDVLLALEYDEGVLIDRSELSGEDFVSGISEDVPSEPDVLEVEEGKSSARKREENLGYGYLDDEDPELKGLEGDTEEEEDEIEDDDPVDTPIFYPPTEKIRPLSPRRAEITEEEVEPESDPNYHNSIIGGLWEHLDKNPQEPIPEWIWNLLCRGQIKHEDDVPLEIQVLSSQPEVTIIYTLDGETQTYTYLKASKTRLPANKRELMIPAKLSMEEDSIKKIWTSSGDIMISEGCTISIERYKGAMRDAIRLVGDREIKRIIREKAPYFWNEFLEEDHEHGCIRELYPAMDVTAEKIFAEAGPEVPRLFYGVRCMAFLKVMDEINQRNPELYPERKERLTHLIETGEDEAFYASRLIGRVAPWDDEAWEEEVGRFLEAMNSFPLENRQKFL